MGKRLALIQSVGAETVVVRYHRVRGFVLIGPLGLRSCRDRYGWRYKCEIWNPHCARRGTREAHTAIVDRERPAIPRGRRLGLFISSWCTGAALAALTSVLPAISEVRINDRVLLFSFALSLLTGVFFGFAPAFKAGGFSIHETLRQGGRGVLQGRNRLQYMLIVAEVALTLILLVGAGLMMRSLHNSWNVSPGFNPEGVLVFYTGLSPQRASSPEKTRQAFRELNDRLSALPGIEAASIEMGGLPFLGNTTIGFSREDDMETSKGKTRMANLYAVGRDYFRAMGIPLSGGRSFTDHDTEKGPLVTVIDEELAGKVFPGQNPIGKHIRVNLSERPVEIVGIAGHVKHSGLDSDATAKERSQLYLPISQLPDSILPLAANAVAGIVRSKTNPATLVSSIRKNLSAFDGERAVHSEQLMTDAIASSLARGRFSLIVVGAFAAVALILSITGIYGVVSRRAFTLGIDDPGVLYARTARRRRRSGDGFAMRLIHGQTLASLHTYSNRTVSSGRRLFTCLARCRTT